MFLSLWFQCCSASRVTAIKGILQSCREALLSLYSRHDKLELYTKHGGILNFHTNRKWPQKSLLEGTEANIAITLPYVGTITKVWGRHFLYQRNWPAQTQSCSILLLVYDEGSLASSPIVVEEPRYERSPPSISPSVRPSPSNKWNRIDMIYLVIRHAEQAWRWWMTAWPCTTGIKRRQFWSLLFFFAHSGRFCGCCTGHSLFNSNNVAREQEGRFPDNIVLRILMKNRPMSQVSCGLELGSVVARVVLWRFIGHEQLPSYLKVTNSVLKGPGA
jgi:hypothetical protein